MLVRTPGKWTWISPRRQLESHLFQLHKQSNLSQIKEIHAQILKAHLHLLDPSVPPKLISAYSLSLRPSLSLKVFTQTPHPKPSELYNNLIRACTHNSLHALAFSVFFEMQRDGVFPDDFTYTFLLKACHGQFALTQVDMINAHVVKFGFFGYIFVPNSFIDAYSKAGSGTITGVMNAKKVFDKMLHRDVVSWNSMLAGFVRAGEMKQARKLFDEMPERDTVSWNTLLDGYVKTGSMDEAFHLFEKMPQRNVVSWSTILSGYCKKGDMKMARKVFDIMPVKNMVSWTIILSGYAEKGLAKDALDLFNQMKKTGLEPDSATIVSTLMACAESGLLSLGEKIHDYITRSKLRYDTKVCNALVDMYAKCGSLDKSWQVFKGTPKRDIISWNSIINGFAMHGQGKKALDLFEQMIKGGLRPDRVTLVGVLCACTHMKLVDKARTYFKTMEREFGISPQIEHYGCMIDVLGRAGLLNKAFDLIRSMPFEPNVVIWGTLLGACRKHKNVLLAEIAAKELIKLEPSDAGHYAVLSNIYAEAGKWDGAAKARVDMKETGSQKQTGSSWIELDDDLHEFTVGDTTHPDSDRIWGMLDRVGLHLKQVGYALQR
ncbi:hypothetical protein LUZ60_004900 [Juncus effusus]|nr:hypothetical protein LUZ60_004900 [Juncus effusus]